MLLLFWVITAGLALNADLALADGIKACKANDLGFAIARIRVP